MVVSSSHLGDLVQLEDTSRALRAMEPGAEFHRTFGEICIAPNSRVCDCPLTLDSHRASMAAGKTTKVRAVPEMRQLRTYPYSVYPLRATRAPGVYTRPTTSSRSTSTAHNHSWGRRRAEPQPCTSLTPTAVFSR